MPLVCQQLAEESRIDTGRIMEGSRRDQREFVAQRLSSTVNADVTIPEAGDTLRNVRWELFVVSVP